ncbi:ABC transporter ATP-binding protein [Paenibacillus sp. YYML68]|uniref:ABC transporter ATP-binding protein n=1 Tax=Paenibacillus sp. YYML68 TaxID=2909250 RepID=UPI002492C089|nr:ABC transporter ATP-binding protein [Paenibacillus sp. YYML68]
MEQLAINELQFTYPDQPEPVLRHVNLSVRRGELIVLAGPSGCGKTTLLRLLKAELQPVGRLEGEIRFRGKLLGEHEPAELACRIGLVQQQPDNQLVMDRVLQELAFGLENMGVPADAMRRRIAELVHYFGMESWLHQSVHTLSGGQKQTVNLVAALLLQPEVLLLDEPTAQLDPVASKDFLQMLRRLNEELGVTIILTEHRLEELSGMADRLVVLGRDGTITYAGPPRSWIGQLHREGSQRYEPYMPGIARLYLAVQEHRKQGAASLHGMGAEAAAGGAAEVHEAADAHIPLSVREGRQWLQSLCEAPVEPADVATAADSARNTRRPADDVASRATGMARTDTERADHAGRASSLSRPDASPAAHTRQLEQASRKQALLDCRELTFSYADRRQPVLRQLDLQVTEGTFLAIVGGNGSGKSTLLRLMAGLEKPAAGDIRLGGQSLRRMSGDAKYKTIGYLAQNAMAYFIEDTVGAELQRAMERSPADNRESRLHELLERFELRHVLERHPHDLSGGELQRAALVGVLLSGPRLLLLDEPTKGIDPLQKQSWGQLLTELNQEGVTIVMVTHDIEFAASYAIECAMLFNGEIAAQEEAADFFRDNHFYTTAVHRAARDLCPNGVTYEEVLKRCLELV